MTEKKNIFKEWLIQIKTSIYNILFTVVTFLVLVIASGFIFSQFTGQFFLFIVVTLALVLGILFQIRFRGRPPSTTDEKEKDILITELKEKPKRINEEITEFKKEHTRLFNLDWIWEMNITEFKYERIKHFYLHMNNKSGSIVSWTPKKQDEASRHDKRFIGLQKTKYNVKAGFNLRSLLIMDDGEVLKCSNPQIKVTGISDIRSNWETKVELRRGGAVADMWILVDPKNEAMDMEFWEKKLRESIEEPSGIEKIDENLKLLVETEAKARLRNLLGYCSGNKPVEFVNSHDIKSSQTISAYIDMKNRDAISYLNQTSDVAQTDNDWS